MWDLLLEYAFYVDLAFAGAMGAVLGLLLFEQRRIKREPRS